MMYRTKAAADFAGMSERTFRRWAKRIFPEKKGSYVRQTNLFLYSHAQVCQIRDTWLKEGKHDTRPT